jgi:[ribosomal protein S18]-alanine N-acetyltransferase
MILRPPLADDAAALAAIHLEAFDEPWDEVALAVLLAAPGALALVGGPPDYPSGFILCRMAGDEAEILTLAVRPGQRRRGVGAALLRAVIEAVSARGAGGLFLEVAADNLAARALYGKAGFVAVGGRSGYYRRGWGAIDAIVLRRELNR